ncbi:MAG: hypothetical protein ABJD53_16865 [Gammaproteobacteria bacterium]
MNFCRQLIAISPLGTIILVPGSLLADPLPAKPPVATAVAPQQPIVGGKPRPGSHSELNPQPIPPGHGGPGDPQR